MIDAIEALRIDPAAVAVTYWRTVGKGMAARQPLPDYTAERRAAHLAREDAEMSRLVFFPSMGIGLAALRAPAVRPTSARVSVCSWATTQLSVPRGWCCVGLIDSTTSLHVGGIVLAQLRAAVAPFAGQRGYLPKRRADPQAYH